MKNRDIMEETYAALSANKVRSGLTMLGIVIGIASVIALVAIGQGAQSSVQTSIESIGSNLIEVMPGAAKTIGFGASGGRGTARSLTVADENALTQQVANVTAVSGEYSAVIKLRPRVQIPIPRPTASMPPISLFAISR